MDHIEIPSGSKIRKDTSSRGDVTLYWHKPDGGVGKYFISIFLLAWMGGWFMGFKDVLTQLIDKPDAPNNGFLMFWLAGWTVGGGFVAWFLFQILRPHKAEKITFHSGLLEYDTGTSSPLAFVFNMRYVFNPVAQWSMLIQKQKIFSGFQRGEVQFVHEKNPSRIYFDLESKRYEIGTGLAEPDIDWLYSQLGIWSK